MKKKFLYVLYSCIFFASISGLLSVVYAEDVAFEATISNNKVSLGTPFRLSLTVHGTQDVVQIPLPAIEGFESRYTGPSSQVSVINNQYTAKKSFNYQMMPLKEGKLVIPPVEAKINGNVYRTEPLIVEVAPAGASVDGAKDNGLANISDKIKMIMTSVRRDVYWHETLSVVIRLYVSDVELRDISFPAVSGEGFEAKGFAQPKRYQESVGGVPFQVIEFTTAVVPTREGTVTIGPAIIEATIPVKTPQTDEGGVFGDDFFRGFFGGYQKRPVRVTSEPLVLNVRPLPDAGRPASFSGAVGQFDLAAEVSPRDIKAGDPLTLRMTVKGSGDLKNVAFPPFNPDGFKSYDPQIKNEDSSLIFEQVLIPSGATIKEVPAVSFNYFDILKGEYQTLTQGPFSLKVEDLPPGQEFKAIGFSSPGTVVDERFGHDIVFIKDHPGHLYAKGTVWSGSWPFLLAVIFYLNVWGGLFAFRRHQLRLESDGAFARRSRAFQVARKGVKTLAILVSNSKSFAGECRRILETFLADVLDLPPGAIAVEKVSVQLADRQVKAEIIGKMISIMHRCNAVCFASARLSEEDAGKMVTDMLDVINDIERRCM